MMKKSDDGNEILSSLSYQILLIFEWWYFALYIVAEFIFIAFKGITFPYPMGSLLSEFVLLIFLCGLEYIRNFLGKRGNLTERILSVMLSLLLTVPVVLGITYFLMWQTYVLRIEVILSGILLAIFGIQSVFAGFSLVTFLRVEVK